MADNGTLEFADQFATWKAELLSDHPEYLSRRGLANAILSMFDGLLNDQDAVSVIAEGIRVYRHWERKDGEARAAVEAHARSVECPSCSAGPGQACRRPNGGPADGGSHRRRHRAASHLGRQAGDTDREPAR